MPKERTGKVRILIADDHPMIRRAVRSTLQDHPHFEVCGEAFDGAQAVEKAKKLKPDVVVLNVTMPVMNGFEAARKTFVYAGKCGAQSVNEERPG